MSQNDLPKTITKKEVFCGKELEVTYRLLRKPSGEASNEVLGQCAPFEQRSYMVEDGIICDQDVPVTMRDGTVIYTDIYRPEGQTNLPVIISWSPFGKRPGFVMKEWQIMGVPPGAVSQMTKFESADPGYWCRVGYAIANVDSRGIGFSEGDAHLFGTSEGRDGYDFIEWVAGQRWCSGKVGMFGNSGVAMLQWWIAAEQPPHLTCIAPWEGISDLYRESLYEGGIPALAFNENILNSLTGPGYVEDIVANAKRYPLFNEYWQDKIPDLSKINIPTYTTGCWNHFHLHGSIEAFRKIRSNKKWIRIHREFEWPDTYCPEGIEELRRFFDRYLKDIRNGWELTPRVRLEVMDAYEYNYQVNRPEDRFPLKRTEYKKLFLDAQSASLSDEPVAAESKVSYDAATGSTVFDFKFNEEMELTGYMKLHLWVEADGNDDMDLFIAVGKLNTKGEWVPVHVLGESHPGAWGKLRVSHRALDEKASKDYQPVLLHTSEEKLSEGEIVPVEIEIWPHSRIWHKGQSLRVIISGHYARENWFEHLFWDTNNKGNHVIHTGGKYDSYLQVPVIPPRYQDGDYIYR